MGKLAKPEEDEDEGAVLGLVSSSVDTAEMESGEDPEPKSVE